MHQRRPHRFFIGLFAIAAAAIHLAPGTQAADVPKPAATPTQKTSVIALCDADSSAPGGQPGIGAKVAGWHAYGSKEFNQEVQNWIDERSASIINSDSVNRIHRSYPANSISKPDLSKAEAARETFFNLTFGKSEYGVGSIVSICETKVQLALALKTYQDQKKLSDAPEEVNSCKGAFVTTKKYLDSATTALQHYSGIVNGYLNGYNGKLNQQNVKLPSLTNEFKKNRSTDNDIIQRYIGAAPTDQTTAKPTPTIKLPTTPENQQALVQAEFYALWGKSSADKPDSMNQLDPNGTFANVLLQTRTEKMRADDMAADIKKEAAVIKSRQDACDGTAKENPKGTKGDTDEVPPKEKPTDSKHDTTEEVVPKEKPTDSKTPVYVDPGPRPGEQVDDTGDGKGNKKPSAGMSFLKNNWMWLAGGAVLVGGGVLLYKHYKKEKDEKARWQDDANFMPNNSQTANSNASGSTTPLSSTGGVPAGAKLIFTTSISGASVGQTLSPITLVIVDANGVQQSNVNGIQVEASCLTPNPCSLDGAKSVTLNGGTVTFSNLKFNQADKGVTLQFSAPGVASVTTPGTFDVGGTVQRQ